MNLLTTFAFLDTITLERVTGWAEFGASAVLILGVLIAVHEFGHFSIGRLVGARVDKFSIGFGPKIISKTSGDTEYVISWIPLGGFVKFYGDESDDESSDSKDSFLNLQVWRRLAIVAAGPISNLLLAVVIVTLAAMAGLPEASRVISKVVDDTPAKAAGMLPGDRIDGIDGVVMTKWNEVQAAIQKAPGKEIKLDITRDTGEKIFIDIIPATHTAKALDGKDVEVGRIGVIPDQIVKSYPVHEAAYKGLEWTWRITSLTLWAVSQLVAREIAADQIAGPIGIMQMAGQAATGGMVNLMLFVALISVNLGILNLLPIPVLDGGHILFYSIEALLGRPVKIKHQEIAQQIGIFMLLSLMALAFYNDIARLVSG